MSLVESLPTEDRRERFARQRPWVTIATDAVLVVLAYLTAYGLRFDFAFDSFRVWQMFITLPVLIPVRLIVFWRFGLFRLNWRHVGSRDLFGLQTAVTVSSLLFVAMSNQHYPAVR